MKKITFILIAFLSFTSFSQSWNFTNDAGGWTAIAADVSINSNSITLTTKALNNPTINQDAANVNTTTARFIAVTLKTSTNGPSLIRASYPRTTSTDRVYRNVAITKGLSDFKTYYIDLFNTTEWVGTVNDIRIQFKDNDESSIGANHNTTGETIEIDKIEFLAEIPKEQVVSFNFDTDAQGWVAESATSTLNNGIISITPTVGQFAKILNSLYAIDANKYKFIEIKYKNLSADNNQIRFQFRHSGDNFTGFIGRNMNISTSSSDFETIEIDLSTVPEWLGNTQDFQIILRDTDNNNRASAGNLEIDTITFRENSILSVNSEVAFNDVMVYPNPSNGIINIKTTKNILKIELFNIIGEKVFETTSIVNNKINVSKINAGIYLLRLVDNSNTIKTQKLIIN